METKRKYLCLLVALCCVSGLCAQQNFVCSGIVKDKATGRILQDVRIYCRDTIPVHNDRAGTFRIQIKAGDKLHFRKSGYGWHTEELAGENVHTVYLAENTMFGKDQLGEGGKYNHPDSTEVICDGKPVPFAEWDDAMNTPKPEVVSLTTMPGRDGRKNWLILETTFQWNNRPPVVGRIGAEGFAQGGIG